MAVPQYGDLTLPLLEVVKDGKNWENHDAYAKLSEILGLSDDDMTELMPGKNITVFYSRVSFAKSALKRAGLIEAPNRRPMHITQRGLDVLREEPSRIDRKYLLQFTESADRSEDIDNSRPADEDSETPDEIMRRGLDRKRDQLYSELRDELQDVSDKGFERLVRDLCKKMGYGDSASLTGGPGDRGIDVVIHEDKLGLGEICIQAKKWKDAKIQPKDVRDFVGALAATNTKKGIFVTTSFFTDEAKRAAADLKDGTRVILIDGMRLVKLMDEHRVGVVESENITINRLDGDYFEQLD